MNTHLLSKDKTIGIGDKGGRGEHAPKNLENIFQTIIM